MKFQLKMNRLIVYKLLLFPIIWIINWILLGLPTSIIFCKILGYEIPFPLSGTNVNHYQFYLYKYACIAAFSLCFPLLMSFCVKIILNNKLSIFKFLLITTFISQIFFGCVTSIYPDFSVESVFNNSTVTEYSHIFSYMGFSKVKIGMSKNDVVHLIGNGYKHHNQEEYDNQIMHFSRSTKRGEKYWMIKVEFDETDTVRDIIFKYNFE